MISDAAADKNVEFTFTVTLSDTTISKTYGDMTFENGVATVTLKDGQTASATGLPTGITYTITEAAATGFQLTGKTGDTGTISTTASTASFTVVYSKALQEVIVSVTVNADAFDEDAVLVVTPLEDTSEGYQDAAEKLTNDGQEFDGMLAYDIGFQSAVLR